MSKGQFNINVDHQAQNMMFALLGGDGKTEEQIVERCKVLCGLIDEIAEAHPDFNLGQILEEASMQCETMNEVVFMGYVIGTHVGMQKGYDVAHLEQHLRPLFEVLQHAQAGHSFSMS